MGVCPLLTSGKDWEYCIRGECELWIPERVVPFYPIIPTNIMDRAPSTFNAIKKKEKIIEGHCGLLGDR